MNVRHYQSDQERTILTALVVNDEVLAKVLAGLKDEKRPFESKWSNQIFSWCLDFHRRFQKAPKAHIQTIFNSYASKSEGDHIELIGKYLSQLSDRYQEMANEINVEFLVDSASKFFNRIRIKRLTDDLETKILENDIDGAEAILANHHAVSFSAGDAFDVMDVESWKEVLTPRADEAVISYPDALGEFFGAQLCPDAFISFIAPEKRGKSFWLVDLAYRSALLQRNRTLFYSLGDMSKRQTLKRFICRILGRPIEEATVYHPLTIQPVKRGEPVLAKLKSIPYTTRVTKDEIIKARERVKLRTATENSLLEITAVPTGTMSIAGIDADIASRIQNGWVPKVVVIDYADIAASEPGSRTQDYRHQINETWAALRRLAQKYHICVVTATQSDAASYNTWLLTRDNFSEDKRKLAHVTGMCGLNQTEEEKKWGVYRLNWVALREGVYFETKYVTTCGCLEVSNPAMKSVW